MIIMHHTAITYFIKNMSHSLSICLSMFPSPKSLTFSLSLLCLLLCTHVIKPQTLPKPQNQSRHQITSNKTYTNVKHKLFEELVPSVLPLLKKHIRLGHAGMVDHLVDLSISFFFKCGIDKSAERSTITLSPSLMCFLNRGNTEGTNFLKILCLKLVYVCFI